MQEEEKSAVEFSASPASAAKENEETEITHPSAPEASGAGTVVSNTVENASTAEDKITAIRTSLYEIAQHEEEEQVTLRVAYQIKQVKERKEHPEKFVQEAPKQAPLLKKHKKTCGQRIWGLFPQKGDTGGEIARKSIFLLSMTVFLICMVLIALYFVDIYRTDKLYDEIGTSYHARQPERVTELPEESLEEPASKIYTLLPGAEELLAINDEIVGWISIPDTNVDYPVLQHLEDEPGNEYYLYRNVQREESKPGSIFLDNRCTFDRVGEDGTLEVENSDNLIIYGHNMRDLSMFGTLKYYRTDEDYYEEHPVIELNSNYETYQYKIFGYFIADADDTTETRFEYWNAINFADETEFYDYVNEVKRRTLRLTNVDVEYGDSLLTLSTCSSVFDTARLVIVARLVRDGEDPYERVVGSTPNPNIKWPSVYYLWNENTYDPDAPFVPYG